MRSARHNLAWFFKCTVFNAKQRSQTSLRCSYTGCCSEQCRLWSKSDNASCARTQPEEGWPVSNCHQQEGRGLKAQCERSNAVALCMILWCRGGGGGGCMQLGNKATCAHDSVASSADECQTGEGNMPEGRGCIRCNRASLGPCITLHWQ